MTITIGADPEVFLNDGNIIVSAIGHVGGTKEVPVPVMGGAVQEDNVLAEFNIDPAANVVEFITNIKSVMGQLRERVHPLGITVQSSHIFTRQALMRSGRKALMFGCDPDYNAYTGDANTPPSPLTELRTAGGHVHIGYENPSDERSYVIAKNMDLLLGVPSVLLDSDTRRRSMYGRAGAIRMKPYGVEYRSLSNFWLQHTDLMAWVFNQSVLAANSDLLVSNDDSIKVVDCINNSDRTVAEQLLNKYKVMLP